MFWSTSGIATIYENSAYKKDIIFTGRLSDDELKLVLGSAYALSFVPIFEGFGLPIVEAFEAGVPVISANTTSLPEVAGDAAVYVDPFNVTAIADAMMELYENKNELREKLIEKGFAQKILFSWDNTARLLWNCIKKAV